MSGIVINMHESEFEQVTRGTISEIVGWAFPFRKGTYGRYLLAQIYAGNGTSAMVDDLCELRERSPMSKHAPPQKKASPQKQAYTSPKIRDNNTAAISIVLA